MKLATHLITFAKGVCMGIADVIPGVSGGTLALILGIYQQFIEAIKSINPKPLVALLQWLKGGFKPEGREAFMEALGTIHLSFLIPLGLGIVLAMGVGSAIIPGLMESYPEIMRGLFFGLILASVPIPIKLMPRDNATMLAVAAAAAVVFGVFGFVVTNPNALVNTTSEWVDVTVPEGDPMDLKHAIRRGPSSLTAEQVFWSERNGALRDAIKASAPDSYAALEAKHNAEGQVVATDKRALKRRAQDYNDLVVPVGTVLHVPRPSHLFIFFAASIAICAMVLPGISGSFILLVLGCYYFILNALKGSLSQLAHLELPVQSLAYVGLFICGIAVGILSFARVMAWLLKKFPAPTMGALVGLMIGCLRGIWPYQSTLDGQLVNVLPKAWGSTELMAIGAMVVGFVLVVILNVVGDRTAAQQEAEQDPA
ncbi:MAG: hypothetical protein CMH57_06175 [Myxococcales bacterium]|nr:hypothetical protein [Myxococcales bacterium]